MRDLPGARAYLTEALAIFDAIGGSELDAHRATMFLARIEFLAGNVERAVQLSTASLASTPNTFSFDFAGRLSETTTYLIACNRWDDARKHACEALELAQDLQHDVCRAWTIQHLAVIAALSSGADHELCSEKSERVARMLGYVDALIASLGVSRQHAGQQEYDRVLTSLNQAFASDDLSRLMSDGAAMTEDQAVTIALAVGSTGVPMA